MASSAKQTQYTYTPLNAVRVNSKVNVFGVVKFMKQPYKSRGSDYCLVISLVDESFTDSEPSLRCLLFAKGEDLLPVAELGDVVRFHRLSICDFRGELQGQSSPGFSWVRFSGDTGAPLEPLKASSATYKVTDEDKEQVRRLREWASGKDELMEKLSTFYQIGANCYFDLICQVVSVAEVEPGTCQLLRVWDGTRTIYDVKSAEKEFQDNKISTDLLLEERAENLLYDVFVYDNHVQAASKITPGSYVKLINLHASKYKCSDSDGNHGDKDTVEIILHRGNSFGRGIRVLPPDCPTVKSLKERLDKFALPNLSSDTDFTFMNNNVGNSDRSSESVINSGHETDENRNSVGVGGENSRVIEGAIDGDIEGAIEGAIDGTEVATTSDGEHRCMLQTKTVVLNHPHVKRSTLGEVLGYEGPGKFRVVARVLSYHPVPDRASTFLKLRCRLCHHLCDLPSPGEKKVERTESQIELGSSFRGLTHYLCPQCSSRRNSLPELDSPPHLSYIFMMRFVLKDSTGVLIANIWRDDAITFFKNIEPEDVIQNGRQLSQLQTMLEEICPRGGSRKTGPWVECCLRSYTVNGNRHFHIFDTAMV